MPIPLPLRNRHFFVTDIVLLSFAAYLSFVLRIEDRYLVGYDSAFVVFTALILLIVPATFRLGGIYSRYWRFASVEEMLLLAASVATATIVIAAMAAVIGRMMPEARGVPRSIPFIFAMLALICTSAPRLAVRCWGQRTPRRGTGRGAHPVLIMGAGDAGRMLVREIRRNTQVGMQPVGFVDDDARKHGMRIHGVPVLGGRQDIPKLAPKYGVERVIIAMPKAPGKALREIIAICDEIGVQTKTMPGIYELLDGKVSVNQLRNVQIEDLLRRVPVQADVATVGAMLQGKRVLITGGGGSIGSELCRQVLSCEPATLVVLGHGENSVFEIQNELRNWIAKTGNKGCAPQITAVIADIRFPERICAVFEQFRPQIVFHAAAHKHVPLMEAHPEEAVTNNVLGTRNVLNAALAVGVDRFVMISSDKAVNPTSVMGATKRVAELLVHQAARRSGRPYMAVRFGNVLGSRGSVILTFKQQIAAGGPVTVTHPEMRRFFMTIPEAVTLVLQAGVLGDGGEVFVLDMGEPIKVVDLAHDMIQLSGLQVDSDIDIVFTGLRPGEKLYEELFAYGENYQRTAHPKILKACNASTFVPACLDIEIEKLAHAARRHDKTAIHCALLQLVAAYHPMDEHEHAQQAVVAEIQTLTAREIGGGPQPLPSGTS